MNTEVMPTNMAQVTHDQQVVDPLGDGISSIELIRVSGSDIDVVNAARVSFGKYITQMTERDEKLIEYLMKHQHTSPFEHNQLSFRIKAPIYVVRQWMRHLYSNQDLQWRRSHFLGTHETIACKRVLFQAVNLEL